MKVAIMQPYFFPYIWYWQLINSVDTFVIYDDVNYIKQWYINRNFILINNKKNLFSLQLIWSSSNKKINEINTWNNKNKLIKTIKNTYKNAPYYNDTINLIEEIIWYEEINLWKYLWNLIIKISNYLDIKTNFLYSSEIEKNNNLKWKDKVIEICNKLNAKTYINSIWWKELYNSNDFLIKWINLFFLETIIQEYKQFNNEFIPYLSIIDIMMFNSKEEIKNIVKLYIIRINI